MTPEPVRFYRFGPYLLDREEGSLARDGSAVPLSPKTFETLYVLVANSGRLVSKKDLMAAVWPDACVEEANLTVNISLLRKALGESGDGRPYIETLPKRGYRFTAAVTTPAPKVDSAAAATAGGRKIVRPLAAIAAVTLIAAAIWVVAGRKAPRAAVRSVAVLPFRSLKASSADDYLGLGIADALITRLGALRRFAVRPTSAVRKFHSVNEDALTAGRQLQVDAVLEGSVQTLGPRIRVTARLLGIPEGASLWADEFERASADMFEVEDSISQELVTALALKLDPEQARRLGKHSTESGEAYQLYLKGRYFWNRRSAEGVTKARECFEQAIRADPNYALAYAGLADSFMLIGSYGYSRMPPRVAMPRAEAAAERALAIDDSLAEVHASLGYARLVYDWRREEAEKELKRAIQINPLYATAHHWYSHYLAAVGRLAESAAASRRALAIDPVDLALNEHLGWHFLMARQYEAAIQQCRKTLDMDAGFIQARRVLALAHQYKGDLPHAAREFEKALEMSNRDPVIEALLARAYALSGRKAEARATIARLSEMSKDRYVSSADLAAIYTGMGETDQAFAALERAYEERSNTLIYLDVDPGWDPLRHDARFEELKQRIGLW